MTVPVRLQLSRKAGFDLRALSRAVNGLPALSVSRGKNRRWGNPFHWTAAMAEFGCTETEAKQWAKDAYLELAMLALSDQPNKPTSITGCETVKAAIRDGLPGLAGKNLACWCGPSEPCHADVLLELANGPVCKETS